MMPTRDFGFGISDFEFCADLLPELKLPFFLAIVYLPLLRLVAPIAFTEIKTRNSQSAICNLRSEILSFPLTEREPNLSIEGV